MLPLPVLVLRRGGAPQPRARPWRLLLHWLGRLSHCVDVWSLRAGHGRRHGHGDRLPHWRRAGQEPVRDHRSRAQGPPPHRPAPAVELPAAMGQSVESLGGARRAAQQLEHGTAWGGAEQQCGFRARIQRAQGRRPQAHREPREGLARHHPTDRPSGEPAADSAPAGRGRPGRRVHVRGGEAAARLAGLQGRPALDGGAGLDVDRNHRVPQRAPPVLDGRRVQHTRPREPQAGHERARGALNARRLGGGDGGRAEPPLGVPQRAARHGAARVG
mmetsp:Transcript_80604/g.195406  ORF Transcript_80604/g.195406 Transcript_80604/m.195406 type:complete len:273 (+) Transcript_80604:505-1323(+)